MPKKRVTEPSDSLILVFLKSFLSLAAVLALLLLCAGRPDYRQAYAYTLANAVALTVSMAVLRNRPDLMKDSEQPGPGRKAWAQKYRSVGIQLSILMWIIGALDAGRFGWTGDISIPLALFFYLLFFLGQGVVLWAKLSTRSLSPAGSGGKAKDLHAVVDGPYGFIRHPGHLGSMVFTLAVPVLLKSWWAMIPAAASCAVLIIRTWKEDETLVKEMRGYKTYSAKVRYRLIPGIW